MYNIPHITCMRTRSEMVVLYAILARNVLPQYLYIRLAGITIRGECVWHVYRQRYTYTYCLFIIFFSELKCVKIKTTG